MRDYHVYSMEKIGGPVVDHGVALDIKQVPWAGRQMWAPDAAEQDGRYYLYFPVKDKQDVFRIGAAVGKSPQGRSRRSRNRSLARTASTRRYSRTPMGASTCTSAASGAGSCSAGLLAPTGKGCLPGEGSARAERQGRAPRRRHDQPRGTVKDVVLLDEKGQPITAGDNGRRFFEAAWVHKYNGTYYFSYSTGDTHFIMYATGKSPYGPFTVRGKVLEPVLGWTNHHSIVEFQGKWYLFYHDAQVSGGQTHLRNIKMVELVHRPDGSIATIDPYRE